MRVGVHLMPHGKVVLSQSTQVLHAMLLPAEPESRLIQMSTIPMSLYGSGRPPYVQEAHSSKQPPWQSLAIFTCLCFILGTDKKDGLHMCVMLKGLCRASLRSGDSTNAKHWSTWMYSAQSEPRTPVYERSLYLNSPLGIWISYHSLALMHWCDDAYVDSHMCIFATVPRFYRNTSKVRRRCWTSTLKCAGKDISRTYGSIQCQILKFQPCILSAQVTSRLLTWIESSSTRGLQVETLAFEDSHRCHCLAN